MRRILSALLCLTLVLSPVLVFSAQTSFFEDYDAIESASSSVIYLEADDDFDDEMITTGSGFVAFDNKTFITNYHVIEDAVWIRAYDENYNEYEVGKLIAIDKDLDIAIISFKSPTDIKPLVLTAVPNLKRGQRVAAIGYPQAVSNTFSTGIISALVQEDGVNEIQFTAPISQGSSGGALFNAAGEVIGITSSTLIDSQNINYAVDISHAIALYSQLAGELIDWPASQTINLNAPQNLQTTFSGNSMMLTWSPVAGAAYYRIYKSAAPEGPYGFSEKLLETNYEDKNIIKGSTYYYKVSMALSAMDEEEISGYIEVTVPTISPLNTPEQSPPAESESIYPLEIGDEAYIGTADDPYLNPDIINVSDTQTIDNFTLTYYCEDENEEILYYDDSGDYYSEYTYTYLIKPRQLVNPGNVSMYIYGDSIKYVYAAISQIVTTDGTTYDIPEDEWLFQYWTLQEVNED